MEDMWITPDQAAAYISKKTEVSKTVIFNYDNGIKTVAGLNENDVVLVEVRIFHGKEHPQAKAGMCLMDHL